MDMAKEENKPKNNWLSMTEMRKAGKPSGAKSEQSGL